MVLAGGASRRMVRYQRHLCGGGFRCGGKPVRLLFEGTRPSGDDYRDAAGRRWAAAGVTLISSADGTAFRMLGATANAFGESGLF